MNPAAPTLRVRTILVPTDRSACAERAYAPAAELAAWTGARVRVVHVSEYGHPIPAAPAPVTWDDVTRGLHLPLAHTPPGGPILVEEVAAAYASTAGALLACARTHGADLIVIGTNGRRGLARMVLGSVAEEVVRRAECPVLTVPCTDAPADGPVLAAVDFSEGSREALRHAKALAAERGVALHVVHVVDWPTSPPPYLVDVGLPALPDLLARAEADLDAFVAEEPGLDVVTSVRLRVGSLAAYILVEVAEEIGAGLIVISTHGRTGMNRLLMGSVAERIVRTAPCPVLTVRPEGPGLLARAAGEGVEAVGDGADPAVVFRTG